MEEETNHHVKGDYTQHNDKEQSKRDTDNPCNINQNQSGTSSECIQGKVNAKQDQRIDCFVIKTT